jgi:predicted ATPase
MRIDKVEIESFKNLKHFKIDLDEIFLDSVLLGQNATGKSNFIEALVLIFKFLDLEKKPVWNEKLKLPLNYEILYRVRNYKVQIKYNKSYSFWINGEKLKSQKVFFQNKDKYLPSNVFTYYSGTSNRLESHFDEHQKRFYDKIIKDDMGTIELDKLRKLFYVRLIHSYFVLLSFFSFHDDESKKSRKFLSEYLGIEDIESILFILNKPSWKGSDDPRFWGATGTVKDFLSKVWNYSIAPIKHEENTRIDFKKSQKQEKLFLYLSSKDKLQQLAKEYSNNTEFFKALESTYISDLISEIRVKVKKRNLDGEITFKELSEGEQQLLTVLGLLRFTKEEETLVLLDEPDTHLNPKWKWEYLGKLREVVGDDKTTHIILNTHDPLVIGGMVKEQVRIFTKDEKTGEIKVTTPDIDPRGLGVAGILTSELFGLSTTLDPYTMNLIEEKMEISTIERRLTTDERNRLKEINIELEPFGLNYDRRFPDIAECLKEKFKKNRGE